MSGCNLVLIFLRQEIRVELQLNRSDAVENKWLFDRLVSEADDLATKVGEQLDWRRLDDKKVSIIQCRLPVQGYTKENWPEMVVWPRQRYAQMEAAFSDRVNVLAGQMKMRG